MDYGVVNLVNLVGLGGSFKNTLERLQLLSDRDPPYLANKLVGLVSTAGGVRGLQAVNTMEFVVRALRGWAVPLVIPVPRAWQAFDDQGRALDLGVGKQLRELGAEVTKSWLQFRSHGFCDYSSPKTSRSLSEEYVVYFVVWPMLVGDGYSCRCQAQMA